MTDWIFKLRYVRWWKKALGTNPDNEPWDSKDARLFYGWACGWLENGANEGGCMCDTPEDCAAEDLSNA